MWKKTGKKFFSHDIYLLVKYFAEYNTNEQVSKAQNSWDQGPLQTQDASVTGVLLCHLSAQSHVFMWIIFDYSDG